MTGPDQDQYHKNLVEERIGLPFHNTLITMKKTLFFILTVIAVAGSAGCKKNSTATAPYYPTDSLAAYFSFDNGSINDVVGHATGTNHNSAAFVTGAHGQAISLNGVDQYLDLDNVPINSVNGISVSLWMKSDTTSGTTYFLTGANYGFFTSGWVAGFAVSNPSTNSIYGTFHSQQWTHLVGTYDGTAMKVYVNGALAQTTTWPSTLYGYSGTMTLGYFGSTYWGGSVDELFIYHRVLTQADVARLYHM